MSAYRILIIEDEVLIADTIERYLLNKGYLVTGKAISYQEAKTSYRNDPPDLVLIDIRLSGAQSGIDFAHFLRTNSAQKTPYVFLTSQLDRRYLEAAKETFPAGFLSKPLQKESLYATIEVALHNHYHRKEEVPTVLIRTREASYQIAIDELLYLQADHVYVRVHLTNGKVLVQRGTLQELLDQLPADRFVQTHRSYVVNVGRIKRWDAKYVYLEKETLPLSRSRREEIERCFAALSAGSA